jgi:hypothetical protein
MRQAARVPVLEVSSVQGVHSSELRQSGLMRCAPILQEGGGGEVGRGGWVGEWLLQMTGQKLTALNEGTMFMSIFMATFEWPPLVLLKAICID